MHVEEVIAEFQKFGIPELKKRAIELPTNLKKAVAVVGLRRTGKTYLLYQTMNNLLAMGIDIKELFYINFEDERLEGLVGKDLGKIIELYRKYNPSAKTMYLFLDEVQSVNGWEKFVRRVLERRDARIFVTGSSSQLFSREIATALRGRSMRFHLLPLSFKEFLNFRGLRFDEPFIEDERGLIKGALEEYMEYGGFPEIANSGPILRIRTLQEYLDLVIYRDLVERYSIKKIGMMKSLIRMAVKNFSTRISIKRLRDSLTASGASLSKNKVYEYFSYLEDMGFVVPVKKFSYSEMERMRSMPKIYIVDTGYPTIYGLKDIGRRMENVVGIELLRRRYYRTPTIDISYHLTKGRKEVDFVVSQGMRVSELIQVCYDPTELATKKREANALIEASRELGCKNLVVITWDYEAEEGVEGRKIRYIPLWKYLLEVA